MAFFSSRPSHPLADSKELKQTLESLVGLDAATVLDETRAWLESLTNVDDMKVEQCLEIIFRLDESVQIQALRLGRDYLTAPRQSRSEEYRLWNCNYTYWKQLAAAYEACSNRLNAGERLGKSRDAALPLMYLRLLRAYATSIKWTQFRYVPVEQDFWLGVGRVYLAALAAKVERTPLAIYPNARESTVEREYLQVLMLHSSSINGLMPLEVELAERLVAYLVPQLVFTNQVHPANVYWVDPSKALPPTRLARPPEITPTLRFLRPDAALEKVAEIRERIAKDGGVPPDLQLGGQYPSETVLSVLDHLALNWQPKPPMRSHQRHMVKSRLSVIHGLATIHDRLTHGKNFFADSPDEEAWIAEDVSMGGMGAQVPLGVNDWIAIGALIAIQPDGGDNWLIGMIRRYSRGDGRGSVGIQTIGKAPRAVVADGGGLHTDMVLLDVPHLPVTDDQSGDSLLLEVITVDAVLQESAFETNIPLETRVDDQFLRLRPQFVIERGLGFVIARFQIERLS